MKVVTDKAKYKRVLLKLSGEALMGQKGFGIDRSVVSNVAQQIKHITELDVETGIVVGGGNFWRGTSNESSEMDRATADYAGMLATIINALVLQDALEKQGVVTRTQTAINIQAIAEPYIRRRAMRHLEKKRAVIFAGGTGNPYMTTDTAAALRANAKKFDHITHQKALELQLRVMDITAFSLCRENRLAIIIFDLQEPYSIDRAIRGEKIGTLIDNGGEHD
ncbi:MAG: uridine monophosphate kinase [Dehalococcoidia bacterium]